MDAGIADTINRRDAQLLAEFLDALDTRLPDDRKPWHLGPMGEAFLDEQASNSYRAWLFGKHAYRIPSLAFDGNPADGDWDNLFQHFRAAVLARRDPKSPPAGAAAIQPSGVV
jgi:hypothetical protein